MNLPPLATSIAAVSREFEFTSYTRCQCEYLHIYSILAYLHICIFVYSHPTPRIALFVDSTIMFFTPSNAHALGMAMGVFQITPTANICAYMPENAKGEVKRPEGPPARSRGPEQSVTNIFEYSNIFATNIYLDIH